MNDSGQIRRVQASRTGEGFTDGGKHIAEHSKGVNSTLPGSLRRLDQIASKVLDITRHRSPAGAGKHPVVDGHGRVEGAGDFVRGDLVDSGQVAVDARRVGVHAGHGDCALADGRAGHALGVVPLVGQGDVGCALGRSVLRQGMPGGGREPVASVFVFVAVLQIGEAHRRGRDPQVPAVRAVVFDVGDDRAGKPQVAAGRDVHGFRAHQGRGRVGPGAVAVALALVDPARDVFGNGRGRVIGIRRAEAEARVDPKARARAFRGVLPGDQGQVAAHVGHNVFAQGVEALGPHVDGHGRVEGAGDFVRGDLVDTGQIKEAGAAGESGKSLRNKQGEDQEGGEETAEKGNGDSIYESIRCRRAAPDDRDTYSIQRSGL